MFLIFIAMLNCHQLCIKAGERFALADHKASYPTTSRASVVRSEYTSDISQDLRDTTDEESASEKSTPRIDRWEEKHTTPSKQYRISIVPQIWITNYESGPIEVSLYFKTPFDPTSYDKDNDFSYETSSQHVTLTPSQTTIIHTPLHSKLHGIKISYHPVNPAAQRLTFRTRSMLPIDDIAVGEKFYSHNIIVHNRSVAMNRFTHDTKTNLFENDY
jgi:hypothetical protein